MAKSNKVVYVTEHGLYYRPRAHFEEYQAKKRSALQLLRRFAGKVSAPYLSMSFGKDSTVALALMAMVFDRVQCVYVNCGEFDEWPDTARVRREIESRFPVSVVEVPAQSVVECYRRVGYYYITANSKAEKQADREYAASFISAISEATSANDGFVMGLRADESPARRSLFRYRGPLYHRKSDAKLVCCPLHNWTVDDVWTFTVEYDLPYNELYDYVGLTPMEPGQLRNGAMFAYPRSLRLVRDLYPELFYRFQREFPNVLDFV